VAVDFGPKQSGWLINQLGVPQFIRNIQKQYNKIDAQRGASASPRFYQPWSWLSAGSGRGALTVRRRSTPGPLGHSPSRGGGFNLKTRGKVLSFAELAPGAHRRPVRLLRATAQPAELRPRPAARRGGRQAGRRRPARRVPVPSAASPASEAASARGHARRPDKSRSRVPPGVAVRQPAGRPPRRAAAAAQQQPAQHARRPDQSRPAGQRPNPARPVPPGRAATGPRSPGLAWTNRWRRAVGSAGRPSPRGPSPVRARRAAAQDWPRPVHGLCTG
jgi:hypothetical protein